MVESIGVVGCSVEMLCRGYHCPFEEINVRMVILFVLIPSPLLFYP